MKFAIDRREVTSRVDRANLGLVSRPKAYTSEKLDEWDDLALAHPGFFQCALRSAQGDLLSCSTLFVEGDTAIMMYQLNDKNYPELGLNMTLRGFLIEHCIEAGIRRLVLPMGISGHLEYAASTNSIAQVLFVKSSLTSIAKAALFRFLSPRSELALMVGTNGFAAQALACRRMTPPPAKLVGSAVVDHATAQRCHANGSACAGLNCTLRRSRRRQDSENVIKFVT